MQQEQGQDISVVIVSLHPNRFPKLLNAGHVASLPERRSASDYVEAIFDVSNDDAKAVLLGIYKKPKIEVPNVLAYALARIGNDNQPHLLINNYRQIIGWEQPSRNMSFDFAGSAAPITGERRGRVKPGIRTEPDANPPILRPVAAE